MPKKKYSIPDNLSAGQLLEQQKKQINQNWNNSQDWTNLHNRGFIFRANKAISLPYRNVPLIETIHVQVSLKIEDNKKISIYFSNLNVDNIPNPVLYLYTTKRYHFQLMDSRISLFLGEQKKGGFFNLKNITNNPLENNIETLTYFTTQVLDGSYIITTSLLLESTEDKQQLYTITAGNRMFILNKNYSQNYRMLISPGYNLLVNLKTEFNSVFGLIGEIFGKIKKELSVPKYYYQDINSRLWVFLYNQDNRLNLMSLIYSFNFISEKKILEVFPNFHYLTNIDKDSNLEDTNIQGEISSLSDSGKRFLINFLKNKGLSLS